MITITETDLEATLKTLLQRNLTFVINRKTWRTGRMALFKQNGFHIEFVLINSDGKKERFEIPIPFDIINKSDSVIFSYEVDSLVCNKPEIVSIIKKLGKDCKSKYFNNFLEIRIS
jgi:hypothetical protein